MRKIGKLVFFIFPFLLNKKSLSELSDSKEINKKFKKSKCGYFEILNLCLFGRLVFALLESTFLGAVPKIYQFLDFFFVKSYCTKNEVLH